LAEEIGLIVPLGEWVLREALFEAARWPEHIKVAVNLSPAQFRSGRLVHTVTHALATSGVDPARLELEITEGVLLADTESALATLHQLRSLGVRTAMDDFGTGYSSLSYLRSFPFDKLKIDQSFVRDIGNKAEAEAIVRTTIALAKSLGMSTTAEGVETEEQLQLLREEGCAEVQGYLLGRPDNADAARTLLARSPDHKREQSVKVRASLRSRAGASEIA
jgi:EAL domain-containing protein (putative c-di-GMP-specific phosphodiesterase class I)